MELLTIEHVCNHVYIVVIVVRLLYDKGLIISLLVVKTEDVPRIVELVKQELYTGHIGDGKIFVYKIDNAIRVRTGDEGLDALSH